VQREFLEPRATWSDPQAYDRAAGQLALQFRDIFALYASEAPDQVRQAGPSV
jgi:phosphoenolpyruvate carboxykinase (ATP)